MSTDLDRQLEMAWTLLQLHFDGLTDEEAFWEPAPGSWTIRSGVPDWIAPEPSPSPTATIAWHLWQLGAYWTWMIDRTLVMQRLPWPGSTASAIARIRECRAAWTGQDAWLNFEVIKQTAEIGSIRRLFAWLRLTGEAPRRQIPP